MHSGISAYIQFFPNPFNKTQILLLSAITLKLSTIPQVLSLGLNTWLPGSRGTHKADEGDVWGAPRLQGDGMHPKVLQHVKNRLEPEMLHATLAILVQRKAQVLYGEARKSDNILISWWKQKDGQESKIRKTGNLKSASNLDYYKIKGRENRKWL